MNSLVAEMEVPEPVLYVGSISDSILLYPADATVAAK